MTCEHIFRDTTDIYNRLFNHRAALHGLTNNFVKEFEEKRGDGERVSLCRTLELVTDCRDRTYPDTLDLLSTHLNNLSDAVNKTASLCTRISKDAEEKKSDWLETERQRRAEVWQKFMTAQVTRSSRVDEEFAQMVANLRTHYTDLEEKLKGGKKVL